LLVSTKDSFGSNAYLLGSYLFNSTYSASPTYTLNYPAYLRYLCATKAGGDQMNKKILTPLLVAVFIVSILTFAVPAQVHATVTPAWSTYNLNYTVKVHLTDASDPFTRCWAVFPNSAGVYVSTCSWSNPYMTLWSSESSGSTVSAHETQAMCDIQTNGKDACMISVSVSVPDTGYGSYTGTITVTGSDGIQCGYTFHEGITENSDNGYVYWGSTDTYPPACFV